jgi:hypothetical protein
VRSTTRPVHGPATGWRRLVRAVALGGASYGLAVAAHLTGGGGWPGWPVTLMLTGLLGVMSIALTSRRRGMPFVLLVLTAVQTLLHLLFAQVDGAAASCAVIAGGHHHVTTACAPSVAHAADTLPSLPMAAAHLVATVVTAWLLTRGEAWLWRAVDRLLRRPLRRLDPDLAPVLGIRSVTPMPRVARPAPGAPRGPPGTLARLFAF